MLVRMITAIRRVSRALPLLMCAVLPAVCLASREVPVFTVNVTGQTSAALQQAMRAVLVRATGHAGAATDPQLAAVVTQASQYVQSYQHGSGGQLQVTFNGPALDQAIAAAGRSLWNVNRPFTLIVLSPPPAASSQQAADAAAIQQAAETRGLPISIVPLTVRDANGHLLPAETLLARVHGLGAEQLLIGRDLGSPLNSTSAPSSGATPTPTTVSTSSSTPAGDPAAGTVTPAAPADQWHWTLITAFITRRFTGGITAGIDGTVDFLAPSGQASAAGQVTKMSVRIDGLKTLDDYARVETMLAAVPGVRHSTVARVAPSAAVFDLWARGGAATVSRLLAISPRLKPVTASGTLVSSTLAYRYVPRPPATASANGAASTSAAAAQSGTSSDNSAATPP